MGLIGEDGKPVPTVEPLKKPEGEAGSPELLIRYREDGNLSIEGPTDIRVCLAMLDEAKNIVQARLAANFTLAQLAQRAQGVQKPALRDVLAFSKVKP